MTSEIWEPDAVTPHVRIYEGPSVNAARLQYCDNTKGNRWQTGNTKLNLNQRDLSLLTAEPPKPRVFKWSINRGGPVMPAVRRFVTVNRNRVHW